MKVLLSMTRRSYLLAFAAAPALYSRSWQQPVYPHWNADFVERMLSDSPWAKPFTARFEFSRDRGTPSVRTEVYLTTRWASALPVRQAMALLQAREAPEPQQTDYVIELAGFPATLVNLKPLILQRELAKSARLWVNGRKPIAPLDVDVPEHGMHLQATLRFPRWSDLGINDGAVDVIARTPWFGIEQRFKLKDMVYADRLEL